jgi:hypothetical protein
MAKDKETLEPFTLNMGQTVDQITKQTLEAVESYFDWLQRAMPTFPFPWSNTNLNRILLSNVTQNVTATFVFVHKLSQAKNLQEVVKLQTEFMETQIKSFNEQAKILAEIYSKAAEDAMKGFS